MSDIERQVAQHYTKPGQLESITSNLNETAEDPDNISLSDLKPYDNMHIGGPTATRHLLDSLNIAPGMTVLDIGSGRGGPARQAAAEYDATVTGLDLIPEYRTIATRLSEMVGMTDQTDFITGSALTMPLKDDAFDRAYTIHVSMNIQDKDTLYKEAFRVLTPGGLFGLYDILAGPQNEDMAFPVPWADSPQTSFLISADETIERLLEVGFIVQKRESREEFALSALRRAYDLQDDDRATDSNTPPEDSANNFRVKITNLVKNVEQQRCCPSQIICQKPYKR